MKRVLLLLLMMLFPMVSPKVLSADQSEQRHLTGQVFKTEGIAGTKLVAGAAVWIVGAGNVYTTGADGEYRLLCRMPSSSGKRSGSMSKRKAGG